MPADTLSQHKPSHLLLFSGHMIDAPTRRIPRFPASCEEAARLRIRQSINSTLKTEETDRPRIGITGGACGGDILFLEECLRAGITPHMYLVYPRDMFVASSVSFAGQSWVRRFNKLYYLLSEKNLVFTQDSSTYIPFGTDQSQSIWQRNNHWMLENAFAHKADTTTIIALWNREGANKPGGTADMIGQANQRGASSIILDTNMLC